MGPLYTVVSRKESTVSLSSCVNLMVEWTLLMFVMNTFSSCLPVRLSRLEIIMSSMYLFHIIIDIVDAHFH